MDGAELLPKEIAGALERGATVVTGNQRAARTLRRAFDRRNRGLGLDTWQPAAVMAWDAWTAKLWQGLLIDGHASRLVLNRTQEHAVWRSILETDEERSSLRSIDSLAEMAAEAWRRLCRYHGQGRLQSSATSSDTRAFQRWANAFQRRCREEGLLAQAEVEEALRAAGRSGKLRLEAGGIVLTGFDGMTPAQSELIAAVQSAGCAVEEIPLAVPVENRLLTEAPTEQQEIFAAARWIRQLLAERPSARIAVIVPSLETQRAEIDRVFREVLSPELQNIEARADTAPYEFSLGVPLAEAPMIAAALSLLRWSTEALPLEQVSSLLLSSFFAMSSEERGARAEFDAFELRKAKILRPEITLDWLIAATGRSPRRDKLGRLPGVLRAMRTTAANWLDVTDRRSYAEWSERVRELLDAARWGAGDTEQSIEFQTRTKWESALDEFSTLDFDGARVPFGHALDSLERIAGQTLFAPQSREAPVQVMGPLEAAGSTFDAVWFLRGGDLTWPLATSSSALLPWHLQRELGMPGTDVTRDSDHARETTQRIADSAGTVIFSYAQESVEGRQRPSSVLEGLALDEADIVELAGYPPERLHVALENIEDTARVQPLPDRPIRGGAQILKLQADCGFRAFAEQRLWSTELEPAELGMDARQSGTLVHHVLEYFWDEVKTQSALKAMLSMERVELLDRCIVCALDRAAEPPVSAWDRTYVEMQRERLHSLLVPWLELEMERPSFTVKLNEKKFSDVSIGPLRLSVRIDRVDETDAGELIIDYKTGSAAPSDWSTDRPDAPQLPLYAALSNAQDLYGVAFGLVRAGDDLALRGYAAEKVSLPSRMKMTLVDMEGQVEEWRRVLVALATEFSLGEARVNPKKYPSTCSHCAQRILCRLDASLLEEENELAVEVSRD